MVSILDAIYLSLFLLFILLSESIFFCLWGLNCYFTSTAVNLLSSCSSSKERHLTLAVQHERTLSAVTLWLLKSLRTLLFLASTLSSPAEAVNLQRVWDVSWKNRAICLCHIRKWLACLHPVQLVYEPSFVIFVYICFHFWCLMNVANTIPFFSHFLLLSCTVILKTADAEAL